LEDFMTPPTDQPLNLDPIETVANAATPGPWCTDSWEIYQGTEYEPGLSMWIGETCRGTSSPEQDRADAEFVAHARTDVPQMAKEIHRLRAELAELKRPAVEAQRNEIRDRYAQSIAMAREDRDYEGAFSVECQLREREEQWKAEDAAAASADETKDQD
jgi:hypothetical protein